MVRYKLWAHQEKAIERALEYDSFALFMAPGVGKSATAIRILAERMNKLRRNLRAMIFCPPVVVRNWYREIPRFSEIDLSRVRTLEGSGKERLETLKKRDAHIYICNWQSLLMKDLFEEMKKFAPEFIIWDESHMAKNPSAIRTKKAIELSDQANYKLILTGSPILNSAMDLFAQFRIMDGGATFGKNPYVFRAKYFMDKNARMPKHIHFPNWVLKPNSLDAFNKIVHEKGMVARKEDCLSLPPLVRTRTEVPLSKEQERVYKSMKDHFIAFMNDKAVVADLAIVKALRLQQIISGFVRTDEGDEVNFKENPRIAALEETLEPILEAGEKCIIWAVFHQNYTAIADLLNKMKVKFVELHGKTSEKDRQKNVDAFNQDPDTRVLIGHPGSGGVGVNLIAASYSIYFSRSFSLEYDLQSEARNYRGGSEIHSKITRIDLVTPETIDDLILEKLAAKQAISGRVLMEMVEEMKRQ